MMWSPTVFSVSGFFGKEMDEIWLDIKDSLNKESIILMFIGRF